MKRALAYFLAAAMLFTSLAACRQNTATTIRLMGIQGTVGVADGNGREIQPREDMMIYSGYGMNTAAVSGGEMARMWLEPQGQTGERCQIVKAESA